MRIRSAVEYLRLVRDVRRAAGSRPVRLARRAADLYGAASDLLAEAEEAEALAEEGAELAAVYRQATEAD